MSDAKKKVLVIEDDPSLRDFLQLMIGNLGYAVITAENGRQGFETAERESPAVIVTDMMMPDIGGYEFIREAQGRLYGTPIVIVTARKFDPVMKKDLLGMSNVVALIEKPVPFPALTAALEKAAARS